MVNSGIQTGSNRKLFYGLFVFPLLIAVGMAILLCTVVLLTREDETPESLITAIKIGSPSKRWQKAFELSNELNQGRGMIRESGVMKEVVHILKDRREYDGKTRSYMAVALTHFDGPEVAGVFRDVLHEETDEDVLLYVMWALGVKRVVSAREDVLPYLRHEKEEIRKMGLYVLGVIGDQGSVKAIEPLLEDASRDVRWNAALSLARLGSAAGRQELLLMLDRTNLAGREQLGDAKIEEIMTNAIKGLALLRDSQSQMILEKLSRQDKSLKVRQAALDALKA